MARRTAARVPFVVPYGPLIPTSGATARQMADCRDRRGAPCCPRMFGRVVAWGGARIRPHACCVRRDHPLPVAAGAATLVPLVVPALPRGPRNPSALRALGALPSFFVRLRRGVGGQTS